MNLLIVQLFCQHACQLARSGVFAFTGRYNSVSAKPCVQVLAMGFQPAKRTTCDNTGIAALQLPAMPAPCWGLNNTLRPTF
jgi:hypothetical protein